MYIYDDAKLTAHWSSTLHKSPKYLCITSCQWHYVYLNQKIFSLLLVNDVRLICLKLLIDVSCILLCSLQLLSTHSLDSQAHMNTNSHLNVGGHLNGLKVDKRDTETSRAAGNSILNFAHQTAAVSSTTRVVSQPSVQSLAVNVDMYLSSQQSGAC